MYISTLVSEVLEFRFVVGPEGEPECHKPKDDVDTTERTVPLLIDKYAASPPISVQPDVSLCPYTVELVASTYSGSDVKRSLQFPALASVLVRKNVVPVVWPRVINSVEIL